MSSYRQALAERDDRRLIPADVIPKGLMYISDLPFVSADQRLRPVDAT